MIVIATDFGVSPIYTGQVHARLLSALPGVPIVDMIDDLPPFKPDFAAYLLAALIPYYPSDAVFLCVVDPGVGSGREALLLEADGRRLIGPDNGILSLVARRAGRRKWRRIDWRPERLSNSFHGRDLFAPIAARVFAGEVVAGVVLSETQTVGHDWPDQLFKVIYIDAFGNLITGVNAEGMDRDKLIQINAHRVANARTFSEVPTGTPFWYANGNGLIEVAVNKGRADQVCGAGLGEAISFVKAGDDNGSVEQSIQHP